MKKKTKKLVLAKETVRALELAGVQGGTWGPSWACATWGCRTGENPCEDEVLTVNLC